MLKSIFIFLLFTALVPVNLSFTARSKVQVVALQPAPLPFVPKEFYVSDVVDLRRIAGPVGKVLQPSATGTVDQLLDLEGGAESAARNFIYGSLERNLKLRPVVIHLKDWKLSESMGADGLVNGLVSLTADFGLKKETGEVLHLGSYTGGVRYKRSLSQPNVYESALRQSLSGALQYLNKWMNQQADKNPQLARGIKLTFKDFVADESLADDTVYYNASRPLRWDDFRAKSESTRYAASVFPNFAYEESADVANGVIAVDITMKVYVAKSASWVNQRSDYALNHEQKHFDIVKLVAERFKNKIKQAHLPLDNYDGIINFEYIESYREMNRLQKQYDDETGHGMNQAMQADWDNRIAREMQELGLR